MTDDSPSIHGLPGFIVRQRITMMVNRYEIHHLGPNGEEAGLIAMAQQKRMAFKEQVTFYADEARTQPLFGFKARKRLDLGSGYDVTDAAGAPIGYFKKVFGKSLLRSTWQVATPDGLQATGQERNPTVAILRRFWDMVPLLGDIPVPWLFHFDFTTADGRLVLSSTKKIGLRDRYTIEVPEVDHRRMDWRVAAAVAVALDALQSR